MSALKSVSSLGTILKPPSREHLRKYSWLPDVLRIEGSILGRIIGPVLTVTVFASLVAYAHHLKYPVTLTNSVVPLLAVVVGLILVFRNSTSYDRYYEGRKDFGTMSSNIRNLSRLIWINVCLPPSPEERPKLFSSSTPKGLDGMSKSSIRTEKIRAIKLCVSYAFAVKHSLRGDDDVEHEDYQGILPQDILRLGHSGLPSSYNEDHIATPQTPTAHSQMPIVHAHTPHESDPLLGPQFRTVEFHPYAEQGAFPLPLLIAHELNRVVFSFKRRGLLDNVGPAGSNAMFQLIQSMVDMLSAMERVSDTPIPISYGIHLKQCVTLYLFSLPFTLVSDLNWSMIPVVTVVAFTLMGIEGIANEIENPFGTDHCDLPLDALCSELKAEMEYLTERLPEGGDF
ncbi:UPF0187-domain-containing protein [Sistotremastrum suecicum HHB10207 ss-3]|uniref:UPF0187-domain-containing protein n=1 Tax=Sistotremastrum suecicum HHB10207 ss-3 TaxID=1314776 RepID=A0A166IWB2_9AGAM|nr:UPF0187-domain-containing protein [Sistotremastrum suecicum HHB10207 ss-3]